MMKKKYKLLKVEDIIPANPVWGQNTPRKAYRIKALRNIPEHGVKAGDLGGYVSSKEVLSQEGSCWVSYNAQAIGNVTIKDDALIGGNAFVGTDFSGSRIVVKESAKVTESSVLAINKFNDETENPSLISVVSGQVHLYGKSRIYNAKEVSGNVKVYGDAYIERASLLTGEAKIYGDAVVYRNSSIKGNTEISGNAIVQKGAVVVNCILKGKAQIGEGEKISDESLEEEAIFRAVKKILPEIVLGKKAGDDESQEVKPAVSTSISTSINPAPAKTNRALSLFAKIKGDILSYETDIVKIIKYPVMTDRTDSYTMEMVVALSNAEELSSEPEDEEFKEAVKELQKAFLAAESNALKIASTLLSDEDKKKTEKAKDLLAIAGNESSSENEKKVSFRQAFKQLEGVLVVPEVAVDTFRVKIGLQELEM